MLDTCKNYVVCDKCYDAEQGDRESLKTLEGWSRQMWEGSLSDLCEFCTGLVKGQGLLTGINPLRDITFSHATKNSKQSTTPGLTGRALF